MCTTLVVTAYLSGIADNSVSAVRHRLVTFAFVCLLRSSIGWLTSLDAVRDAGILANMHNLLERSIPRWVCSLKGKVATPLRAVVDSWDIGSSDESEDGDHATVPIGEVDGSMLALVELIKLGSTSRNICMLAASV
jgi:hypothetical protein